MQSFKYHTRQEIHFNHKHHLTQHKIKKISKHMKSQAITHEDYHLLTSSF